MTLPRVAGVIGITLARVTLVGFPRVGSASHATLLGQTLVSWTSWGRGGVGGRLRVPVNCVNSVHFVRDGLQPHKEHPPPPLVRVAGNTGGHLALPYRSIDAGASTLCAVRVPRGIPLLYRFRSCISRWLGRTVRTRVMGWPFSVFSLNLDSVGDCWLSAQSLVWVAKGVFVHECCRSFS